MSTEMKRAGNYYAGPDHVKTDVRRGVARNRAGTRILTLTSDFLVGLRNALVFECGQAADVVMMSAGRRWGKALAVRMGNELHAHYAVPLAELPLAVFQGCLVEAFNTHGLGKLAVDVGLYAKGILVCTVENPMYAGLVEAGNPPADRLQAGILAGMFSQLAGRELGCVQTQCQCQGAPDSRFVLTLAERLTMVEVWRNEGKSHAEIVAALAQTRV
jgi:predicted hydrocarbon binding protein